MVIETVLRLLGLVLSSSGDPLDDPLLGSTDSRPSGMTTKTQGTGYFPPRPSRGMFGTGTGSRRSPHDSIEAVAEAAGVGRPPGSHVPAPDATAPGGGTAAPRRPSMPPPRG